MKTKTTIAREEDYKTELRKYYSDILKGRLLSLNFSDMTDEELQNSIIDYDAKDKVINNNFCSWLTIGEIGSSEYDGKHYKFIKLISGKDVVFNINFSQFKYPMSPNKTNNVAFPSYDATKAEYVCSVDGQCVSPEVFFAKHQGEKMLLVYSFPAVTAFNKKKTCFLFAHSRTSLDDIREYIKYAQYHTIKDIIEYPTLYIPGTTIKIEYEDVSNCSPMYSHFTRCSTTDEFATSLFAEEFKDEFITLFNYIKSKI